MTHQTPRNTLSIIIPAKNEAESLRSLIPELRSIYPDAEIIVVNDGSGDNTVAVCKESGITVHSHPYPMGNGAAIKTGARLAGGETYLFMDADGQHAVEDIKSLLERHAEGFDMVVGARSTGGHASIGRLFGNSLYNWLASLMTGQQIRDLTSGMRVVSASKFREFLPLLPNGFSYPTTITMAFFRSGYTVSYMPIHARTRTGKSHIRPLKDGLRFLLIIFKIGTLYSPLKIFIPVSLLFFVTGLGYYLYTFTNFGRFTNMSALLFATSVIIFMIGLVSEQITSLLYSHHANSRNGTSTE